MSIPRTEPRSLRWTWTVPALALALALLAQLAHPPVLRLLQNAAFDQFERWRPRVYDDPPVRIIDIDDESMRRYGQWPWSRTRVAQLVDALQALEPASIAMDIMFSEPDRTSPNQLLLDQGMPETAARELRKLADHDEVLAQSFERGNVAIGLTLSADFSRNIAELPPSTPLRLKARYLDLGGNALDFLPAYASSLPSLERLQRAAAGQGAMTFVPDADGVVRKVPMLMNVEGVLVPSLAAEAMRLAEHADNYILHSAGDDGGLVDVRIGRTRVDTDAQGFVWVHHSEPHAERYLPAWKVLEHAVDPRQLKGRIALVGTSAQGLMDLRFSPRGGIIPGVEVHAQALEQVLTQQHLARPGWAPGLEFVASLVGGVAIGGVAVACGAVATSASFLALAGLVAFGSWQAFANHQLLIDPTAITLSLFAVFVPTTVVRHLLSERRQRWVREAFARYVSPNLVDYLIAHPDALQLGGRRQRCSFVFADLAGFTSLMETMDPAAAVRVLNAYLDRMIAIAFEHDGTLDRMVGDSVAIVFSAPIEQPDHERRALQCALRMQAFARSYVDGLARQGIAFCETRIGVHTGEVTVGNFGGGAIFDYRALGDPVNTASRLEGANKYLGTLICVSEATLAGCGDAPVRPIGRLRLAGRTGLIQVFEPLQPEVATLGQDSAYLSAFELMTDESPEARPAFELLSAQRPNDPLVQLHARRLREGEKKDLIELRRK